jgi:hypothetical protein
MPEESSGFLFVHAALRGIFPVLLQAYPSDVRVSGFLMHEYESAYAGFRRHRIAFGETYAEAFGGMTASAVVPMAVMRMNILAKKSEYILL